MLTAENLLALLALTTLEIVLGIDNIIFIAILTARVAPHRRTMVRRIGLMLAMGARLVLLLGIRWITQLTQPLFSVLTYTISGRDLVLIIGGAFLIGKATFEIHHKLEDPVSKMDGNPQAASVASVLAQIIALDLVFSLDSVITAVGMAQELWVMMTAVVLAVMVMMVFANPISLYIERHPTMKMLALTFLVLIGVMLVAEGFGTHVSKGYVYFAMAFSFVTEMLNIRLRKKAVAQIPVANTTTIGNHQHDGS